MPKVSLSAQKNQAARDYNKFCVDWEERIKKLVSRSRLFSQSDIEEVVQELLVTFYTKDYLGKHDPELSAFSTSVYNFVTTRIKGLRDKRVRLAKREGLSLNEVLMDYQYAGGHDTHMVAFLDFVADSPEVVSMEFIDMVKSVYKELAMIPVTSTINNFPKLFSCIVQQVVYGLSPVCIEALGEKAAAKNGR